MSKELVSHSLQVDWQKDLPTDWMRGNAFATHVINGINLLFPAGERYFIRSVRYYLDRLSDEHLKAQAKGFFGQEMRHALEHERYFQVLEKGDFRVRPYLKFYETLNYGLIERLTPPIVRLATTAACEHYTAIIADHALGGILLDGAHPTMKQLLCWHAAEEIEHKSVAYDVLQKINSSYIVRLSGLILGTSTLVFFWYWATMMLLLQDPEMSFRRFFRELKEARQRFPIIKNIFLPGIRDYLRRDFHPSQKANFHLATDFFVQSGQISAEF